MKALGRRNRDKLGISCPVTLSFHLIFKFQKVTKLFGSYLIVSSRGLTYPNMKCELTLACSLGTDHNREAGRHVLLHLLR